MYVINLREGCKKKNWKAEFQNKKQIDDWVVKRGIVSVKADAENEKGYNVPRAGGEQYYVIT